MTIVGMTNFNSQGQFNFILKLDIYRYLYIIYYSQIHIKVYLIRVDIHHSAVKPKKYIWFLRTLLRNERLTIFEYYE